MRFSLLLASALMLSLGAQASDHVLAPTKGHAATPAAPVACKSGLQKVYVVYQRGAATPARALACLPRGTERTEAGLLELERLIGAKPGDAPVILSVTALTS